MKASSEFRSRFFWKLYASFAGLLIVATVILLVLVDRRAEGLLEAELEQALRQQAALVEPLAVQCLAPMPGVDAPQRAADELARLGSLTGARLSILRADGYLLADSLENAISGGEVRQRPEFQESLQFEYGSDQRSDELGNGMALYVARAVRRDGQVLGFVRCVQPREAIAPQLHSLRMTCAAGAGLGLLVALVIGLLVARRITEPIIEMTAVAQALRQGRYDARVRLLPRDEIGVLGDTLNRLGAEALRRVVATSKEEARLRAMLVGMSEGVVAVDEQDRIIFTNRAAAQLLGLESADAEVGQRLWERVRLAELGKLLEDVRAGRAALGRELIVRREGKELCLQAHANTFQAAEGVSESASGSESGGVVIVLQDVTNLRRLERIRRDFVANVSHELKTPLTSIKGYVETLLGGAVHDQDNNLRFLSKIDDHVQRLTHLVSDLLSLARIESQEQAVQTVPVDWGALMKDVLTRHEGSMLTKGLQHSLELERGPLVVLADAESLTQVIDNLVDNAIKYTPAPGVIRLSLRRDGLRVRMDVTDSGLGIPEQDLERVFERFYRVDKARSRDVGGTGLGLSIVKHLMSAMNGEVRVVSEIGHGSTFSAWLPAA